MRASNAAVLMAALAAHGTALAEAAEAGSAPSRPNPRGVLGPIGRGSNHTARRRREVYLPEQGQSDRKRCIAAVAGAHPARICGVRLTRKRVRSLRTGAKRKVWWCERCQEVRG